MVAERIRICLRTAQPPIPFEDVRVGFPEWQEKVKATTPNGQLPLLEIDDGRMIMQSGGMFRWAGRLSGHYPEDPAQMLEVEEIIGLVEDLNKQIMPSMYIARMPEAYGHFDADKDKLAAIQGELRKKIVEPTSDFHKIAKLLESKLEGSSSGWFCGDKPTCADIEMFVKMRHLKKGVLDGIPTDIWKTYPKLEALHDKMAATPGAVLP